MNDYMTRDEYRAFCDRLLAAMDAASEKHLAGNQELTRSLVGKPAAEVERLLTEASKRALADFEVRRREIEAEFGLYRQ